MSNWLFSIIQITHLCRSRIALLISGFTVVLVGCAGMEEVDRSYVNLPQMDLRSPNSLGQPSPKSGMRNWATQTGQASCAVCSH